MKAADVKWALGLLVQATLHPRNCDCPGHVRLSYRPPESRAEADTPADLTEADPRRASGLSPRRERPRSGTR